MFLALALSSPSNERAPSSMGWIVRSVFVAAFFISALAQAQSRCAQVFASGDADPAAEYQRQYQRQEKLLREGAISAHWPAGTSSFGARFVKYADHTLGVWKPNYAAYNTLRHEIAAARVDRHLGLHLIPPTVVKDLNGTPGSVQWVVGPLNDKRFNDMLEELGFLDFLIDNRDRSRNNILQTQDGKLVAIDHGLSFGEPGNWRSDKGFKTFEQNVETLAAISLKRQDLEARLSSASPEQAAALHNGIRVLRLQESKLQSAIQVFSPLPQVLSNLKTTSATDWADVLGDSITPSELQALVERQHILIQSFERAEKRIGPERLYRHAEFSSLSGVVAPPAPSAAPQQQLQKMKNRRAFGDF